ncbi:MAG: 30S ribosomal protein S6--L-glutamate ligase, partial [Acidobacteria bacterium]|nr:30S ribosomal protein S6--L-glutamate ligase [Acidobacteriota bacterium]
MKIALLARNPNLYTHRRICEAAVARGHEIEVVNTLRVSINITSKRPALFYRKRRIEGFDAVIPRIGASVTFYGLAVLRQFEVMGVYPLNESVAIGRSRDKLRCLQLLARRGIGLPTTAFTNDPKQA